MRRDGGGGGECYCGREGFQGCFDGGGFFFVVGEFLN